MDEQQIERVLAECEAQLAAGRAPALGTLGFWRAVAAVKRDPALVALFADRVADVDRRAFRRAVPLRVPAGVGLGLLVAGAAAGLALLAVAPRFAHPLLDLVLLAGFGALDLTTHGLAHVVVGTLVGIRFTDWFVDLPAKPQPGLKVDYASYLRTPPRARAWMHASGAIATKLTPFAVLPYALAIGAEPWTIVLLVAVGALQIVTDLLFSVRASDWKKFRREMRLA